jgi:dipeptidase E
VIENSDGIVIGGGNTFKLLHDIYQLELFPLIQQKVKNGAPYIGWSAGANLTGRTICTTNDMPIIQPFSFNAFGFFPFQIIRIITRCYRGLSWRIKRPRLAEFLALILWCL